MGERAAKHALFAQFAAVGKVLGNPARLELLDLLAQGPRSVEDLAAAAHQGMSTCSAHLQTLREAGMVEPRRDGKRVFYSLAGDDVAALWAQLRQVAHEHRPHTEPAARAYLGPDDTQAVDTTELLRRLRTGDSVVLDVRPGVEYAAGHLPGALHIPLEELADRLGELPPGTDIVAYCRGQYCVLAHDAVRVLNAHGLHARRAADGFLEWRVAGVPIESGAA
ncbi:metalloregulator ArsR/SmtB family transcription factor [Nostocoides sp. HKS02]|uniref:ArsR/SmtB family transcription factor n=1 Tax=Nostocoides sp. HKS02 TaxID=1813880 RepID=UPI0012B4C1F7|nr:metalloregulator ArsR/SmtB family transcription factor [Tetrasphaera sp. HKS02]QGN58051.1 metalloregulator ArsR/SmtB family transcription factor [Tetrasphaera sp. HKS02]